MLLSAEEICNAIKESKDMQALCLEGNTIGVDAAKAIAEVLSKRPEFEVQKIDKPQSGSFFYFTASL